MWIQATIAADGRRIYLNARNIRKIVEHSGVTIVQFDETDAVPVREAAAELVRYEGADLGIVRRRRAREDRGTACVDG